MKKLLVSILIAAFMCLLFACDNVDDLSVVEDAKNKEYDESVAPAADEYVVIDEELYTEKVSLSIPAQSDYNDETVYQNAVKQKALELFEIANHNDQCCLRRLAYTRNSVTTAGVEAKNLVIDVKNGQEYLKYDFQPSIRAFLITVEGHGKATYARVGLARAYNIKVDDSVINDDWTGYADFSQREGFLGTQTDMLYFHASQKPLYCVTEAVVDMQTIRSATLTHNDAEGYYTITFDLDPTVSGAAKYLQPSLQKNSGMKSAKYTSITETIEVWDNGFFKRFLSVDKWKSSVVSSTINFDTAYYYDAAHCDMSSYCNNYYATIRAQAEAANAE